MEITIYVVNKASPSKEVYLLFQVCIVLLLPIPRTLSLDSI